MRASSNSHSTTRLTAHFSAPAASTTSTAATLLLAEFGIKHAGLSRIEVLAAAGNHASQRVAEKAGAAREGVLRNRFLLHGKLHDVVLYSLIPGDLPQAA